MKGDFSLGALTRVFRHLVHSHSSIYDRLYWIEKILGRLNCNLVDTRLNTKDSSYRQAIPFLSLCPLPSYIFIFQLLLLLCVFLSAMYEVYRIIISYKKRLSGLL
jgi:hypothetical protein